MTKSSSIKYQLSNISNPKVAIVHDWLYGGGAELVVEALHKMYPKAPIYTSYCTPEWRRRLDNKVVTGYLQRWPFSQLRKFLPALRQRWFKNLDLSDYDLVISSSGNGEAKFVLPQTANRKQQIEKRDAASNIKYQISNMGAKRPIHISYCHTPTHFYWRKYSEYLSNPSFRPKWLVRLGLKLLVKPLRKRDYEAAQKVDYFIANSSHIQSDIKKYYNRDSVVIHPPVDTQQFRNQQPEVNSQGSPTFIMWGRHVPYKRFDLAIRACNELNLPLIVAGSGPETKKLKELAGPSIKITGRLPQHELLERVHSASVFLFPCEEDFGVAPVEAMAAGLPIIALKAGGALDYVVEGETGILFNDQTVESLKKAIKKLQNYQFDSKKISRFSEKFSANNFDKSMQSFLASLH